MMKTTHIGWATRPDGYNGHTAVAQLVYDPETRKLLEVHSTGFHRSPALPMDIYDSSEATYLLRNHPESKRFYSSIHTLLI